MGNIQWQGKTLQKQKTPYKGKTHTLTFLQKNKRAMKNENYQDGLPQLPLLEQILILAKLFGLILMSLIIQAL
jgi:hypothetical protein